MSVSATLAINDEVARRHSAGLSCLPLGFGEAGLPVHPLLTAELSRWSGVASYGPVTGIAALREAAAGYWQRRGLHTTADQVIAGPGSKALLWAVLRACGGAVALPRPSWVSYAAQAALHGLPVHLVPTPPGQGGAPDPERLATVIKAAEAAGQPLTTVVLTLPDNPTGTLAARNTIAAVCELARKHNLTVVSDEIYRDLVHDAHADFVSPAELAPERVVVTTGLSKSLALGGWRTGVARFPATPAGDSLRADVAAIASEVWSAPAQPIQRAAALAFTEPAALRERVRDSRRLHARIVAAVADVLIEAGARLTYPSGGFYLYPDMRELAGRFGVADDTELAAVLLYRCDMASLPGSTFGDDPAALRLRIATGLLYGDDDEQRTAALQAEDPVRLPWIADHLHQLNLALTGARADARPGRREPRPRRTSSPHDAS
ncbi:pyridoxal phosphate-dependent aminotransferase [Dactylosporangium roseum]|nr:pyridoxal phosphate-dependent aminotransferase [Dactylosporangium roseum]